MDAIHAESAKRIRPVQEIVAEGLTSTQAAARLQEYGRNAVTAPSPHGWKALFLKFWGVVPWMLELAIILDLVLRRWVEAMVIGVLLVVNALIGFMQEKRAMGAVALLRQRLTIDARVRRDGQWKSLPASQIVPGDLVRIRTGDIVPADIRITEGMVLLDQTSLTGESLPVEKLPGGIAYSGSVVTRGEASGAVVETGSRTFFGKTAELVRMARAPARLERLIVEVAKYLAGFDILLACAVFGAAFLRGASMGEVLPFVLMLLVASIPHALPTMFAMSAALGARGLADKGILVTRLAAIEDAASMDVLCIDKTGTLTENRLALEEVAPLGGMAPDEVLRLAVMASHEATQDPIDMAIFQAAQDRGLLLNLPPQLSFVPFEPATRRSEATCLQDGRIVRVVKGEPAMVAELAGLPWHDLSGHVAQLATGGARVLAVAVGGEAGLSLAGLLALRDPVRPDSPKLIEELRRRGVRVILVSGDGESTVRAVAAKVGITGEVAPAGIIDENLSAEVANRYAIFARVLPQQKFFLVRALQNAGHIVGMTGDGVNDAPALQQADVGIAMANATDVAKSAASLVLTRPGLADIIMAIEGSRRIYQRMKAFLLTMNTRKITIPLFLALGVLALHTFALTPLLMILFMLTADFSTMSVAMDQATASPVPDRWRVGSLMMTALALSMPLLAMSGLVLWAAPHWLGLDLAQTQTLVFVWLTFAGSLAVLYLTRSRSFFWAKPHPAKMLVITTLAVAAVVTLLASLGWLMAPISPLLIGGALLLTLAFALCADIVKVTLNTRPS